eukprot:SAG31_NODE_6570_length_1969_cov_1.276471_3_plen_127_part_00
MDSSSSSDSSAHRHSKKEKHKKIKKKKKSKDSKRKRSAKHKKKDRKHEKHRKKDRKESSPVQLSKVPTTLHHLLGVSMSLPAKFKSLAPQFLEKGSDDDDGSSSEEVRHLNLDQCCSTTSLLERVI